MKFTSKTMACIAVVAMLFATSAVNADELISNGGFETDIVGPGTDVNNNWNWFVNDGNSNAVINTTLVRSGAQSLELSMAGDDNSFVGIQQRDENTVVGEDYTFSFFARADGALGINAEFRIEWLDASGAFVGDQMANNVDITGSLTDTFQEFSQTHTAPAGAESMRVVFALQSFGAGDNTGTVILDDASLVGVPEPSALGILAVGAIGLIARRRRS